MNGSGKPNQLRLGKRVEPVRVSGSSAEVPARDRQRALTLALLTGIAAFNTIDRQVMTILGAPIKAEFNLSDAQVGLLALIYGVIFALGAAPLAFLAQRTSRKTVVAGCMALFSAATAFCGIASNYAMLVVSRLGVAAGEAGTTAPSQSLIADSYPIKERTFALAIFSVASKPGGFIAFLAGGWITAWLGWRATFLIFGLPGLAIALAAWFLIREPAVGASDNIDPSAAAAPAPTLRECLTYMGRTPSVIHILLGQGLWSLFGLGFVFWIPHYLVRAHELSLPVIGTAMAFYTLGAGAVGVLSIGWLAQKLQVRDLRWILGVLILAALVACPFTWVVLTTESLWILGLCALAPVLVYSANLGPSASAAQSVVPARMRTVTAGFCQVMMGLLGMGLGPFLPGVLSDLLAPAYGDMSIRYSLLIFSICWLWAAFHFFLATRHLARDMARAHSVDLQETEQSPQL